MYIMYYRVPYVKHIGVRGGDALSISEEVISFLTV
jgi:hypothetical protein